MLALLAQAGNRGRDADNVPPEMAGAVLAGVCCFLVVFLVVGIFFLLTLSKALSRCDSRNRTMTPGHLWLNLVPFVNIVWPFITVNRVADSLRNEFYDRGWDRDQGDYGRTVGMICCISNLLAGLINIVSNVEPMVALIGIPFALVWLVCFIIYWVKIANYSSQLAMGFAEDERDDDERDDGDQRDRDRRDDDEYGDRDDRPWERR